MSDQIKFKRAFFGIKKKSVMAYINSVSKNLEDKLFKKDTEISSLKKEIEKLTQCNEKLEKQLAVFEEEKEKISEAFMKADESAKKIVDEACQKAETMLKDAEEKSKEILLAMEKEKEKMNIEFESRISAKKTELSSYKTEINYLREKVKLTLNKFDEILENTIK